MMILADAVMDNDITVKEALAGVGLFDRPGEAAVLMTADPVRNVLAADLADRDVQTFGALYHASGLFRPSAIQKGSGRRQENLARVVWLTLDCDLIDWLGYPKGHPERDEALQKLWDAPQAEIDDEVRLLRATLETALSDLGLPLHRLDYTGYGVCGYLYLAEDDQLRIDAARQVHKEIIARVNELAGMPLVDVQSSDAGTRVTRVPGSLNRKGAIARTVTTLVPYAGDAWRLSIERPRPAASPSAIPQMGPGLAHEDVQKIVDALAPHWALGQKHDIALAFAGMLAKAAIPEEQALAMAAHLAAADAKPWDRANCVRTTYARARAGFTVGGYLRMQTIVPPAALDFVAGILDRHRNATGPRIEVGGPVHSTAVKKPSVESPLAAINPTPPPDSCLMGWVKNYVELVEPLSETSDAFNLACGLVLAGATFGRSITARYVAKSLHANLYMMLVGSAGTSRKDTAIRLALELPTYSLPPAQFHSQPFTVATDVGSAEGLIKILQDKPNILLYVTEYQRLAQNAHRQSTGTIFSLMTSAWDTPVTLQNNTKGNPLEAKFPYLSVLAAVQPGILAQEMQQGDIESGYATRWLFVPGVGKAARPEPPDINEPKAFALYDDLLRLRKDYESRGNGETKFRLSPAATERWIEWYQQDRERVLATEDEDSMRSRLGLHVRKVALVYAATDGAGEIDLRHLEPAIAFVEWSWLHTRELMKGWGVGLWSQVENRIEQVLTDRGPMERRRLQSYSKGRKWSSREFAQVLDAMLKNGQVVADPEGVLAIVRDT
jgi:hypothetical protein